MVLKELFSAYARAQDRLFLNWVQVHLFKKGKTIKNERIQIGIKLGKLFDPSHYNTFQCMINELPFLEARNTLDSFLKKGDPVLSNFVAKPKDEPFDPFRFRAFPAFLVEWNACSRRVFQLGEQTQRLLETANYNELRLDDLSIPFPSFIVRLAVPIVHHGRQVVSVGFSQSRLASEATAQGGSAWSYVLLEDEANYQPLDKRRKAKLVEDMHKSKKWLDLLKIVGNMVLESSVHNKMFTVPLSGELVPIIDKISDDENEESFRVLQKVHAIMVNMLAVASRVGRHGTADKSVNIGVIDEVFSTTNVFDVCALSSFSDVITPGGDEISLNNHTRSVTPHWRRSHMRCYPGTAHIPNAPKGVKVPASLVLGNFLQPGHLPIGSITKV